MVFRQQPGKILERTYTIPDNLLWLSVNQNCVLMICPKAIIHQDLWSEKLVLAVTPGRVAQSVGHLTRKSGVLDSIPSLATYFRFSFRFFKKGSCQLLAKVCAQKYWLTASKGGPSLPRLTDRPGMTLDLYRGRKTTMQQQQQQQLAVTRDIT